MVYQHSFGDLRTGQILEEYLVGGMTWARPLSDAGTASGTINLEDAEVRASNPRLTTAPARSFWMIEWDSVPIWGGIVWTHRYSRKPSRRLQLSAAGLWSLWDHRKALALTYAQAPAAAADLGWSGISLGTQAKRLVQAAMAHTGGAVPIRLPADVAGDSVRNYPAYNLSWVGDLLSNLTGVEGGPEIDFGIERVPGNESYVRFVMRVGEPWLEQTGDYWRFDDTVPEGPVTDLSVTVDGTKMGSRAWVPGEGEERDMLLGLYDEPSELVAAGYPLLELEDTTHKTTSDPITLALHAEDLALRRSRPVEQWSLSVRADAPDASLGQYLPGDAALVQVEDDGYLEDGEHPVRIVGMSGGSSSTDVKLELAPQSSNV